MATLRSDYRAFFSLQSYPLILPYVFYFHSQDCNTQKCMGKYRIWLQSSILYHDHPIFSHSVPENSSPCLFVLTRNQYSCLSFGTICLFKIDFVCVLFCLRQHISPSTAPLIPGCVCNLNLFLFLQELAYF